MKSLIVVFLLALLGLSACESLPLERELAPLAPKSLDEEAGAWKSLVYVESGSLSSPKGPSDAGFSLALDSVKNLQAQLSQEQKNQVNFWAAGAVLRWNEIARTLAAKYNLPPASNAQGIYPVPDPNNPLADPKFPFANPPYAARALAYLSVAQHDALVAAWKYKFQFKRAPAYTLNAGIQALLPKSALPSFPSEEAVVAQASFELLSVLFPGELPYLKSQWEIAQKIGLWSGKNVGSDLAPSLALGSAVAKQVLAHSRTDGMSAANNQSFVPLLRSRAQSLGMPLLWESQESPARPPMLPNFGQVRPWHFDRATLERIRPVKPYVQGSPEFQKDLEELKAINHNQTREQARIANFWSDGPGSYTPPGHWHRYAADACMDAQFSEVRTAKVLAFVGTALMDAGIACWETKYYYYSPRPQQYGLKTSVGLPNFPSYTSGHSTFSFAAATVLGHFFPNRAKEFEAHAQEASDSRVYGLIHFRLDCSMGRSHGKQIGGLAVERAK